jgi:hypothetical protein
MPITLEQAKKLTWNDTLHHETATNADGTPMRFRVMGAVKTWKRDKTRIRVPLKRGLYETGYLVNGTFEGGRCFDLDITEVNL